MSQSQGHQCEYSIGGTSCGDRMPNRETPRSSPATSAQTSLKTTVPEACHRVCNRFVPPLSSMHNLTHILSDSFYLPLALEFQQHVKRVPDTTPREVYARAVVPQTLKSSPPAWYWVGATTGIVRFMDIVGFRTAWVGRFLGAGLIHSRGWI